MSITLCDRKKEGLIPFIERRAGFKFERVGAPQPVDMAKQAGTCASPYIADTTYHPIDHDASSLAGQSQRHLRTCIWILGLQGVVFT